MMQEYALCKKGCIFEEISTTCFVAATGLEGYNRMTVWSSMVLQWAFWRLFWGGRGGDYKGRNLNQVFQKCVGAVSITGDVVFPGASCMACREL